MHKPASRGFTSPCYAAAQTPAMPRTVPTVAVGRLIASSCDRSPSTLAATLKQTWWHARWPVRLAAERELTSSNRSGNPGQLSGPRFGPARPDPSTARTSAPASLASASSCALSDCHRSALACQAQTVAEWQHRKIDALTKLLRDSGGATTPCVARCVSRHYADSDPVHGRPPVRGTNLEMSGCIFCNSGRHHSPQPIDSVAVDVHDDVTGLLQ